MIDWLKLRLDLPAVGRIPGDRVLLLSPDGAVKWEKVKPIAVRGSFESDIHVSACAYTGKLIIDGNPAKFFQGHNVFGSENIGGLARALCWYVLGRVPLPVTEAHREDVHQGNVEVMRVDVTQSYSMGNVANARAAVRALAETATLRHRGRGSLVQEGTAYWGQHSRRSALKVYPKGPELQRHPLPEELHQVNQVRAFADDLVRFELVLRVMELRDRGLNVLRAWDENTTTAIYREFLAKFNVPPNVELPVPCVETLPPRLRLAYDSWMRGTDLRATLPPRTFWRYRKQLLEHGVDIVTVKPASNVVPLVRILEAVPAGVPEWAMGTPLYFDPALRAA